ncbi:MAG: DUF6259 domain-containing protein [Desulfurococcales archaeon]|nr:DUF6259 domain-containing protein [Desulfurococcales archaeon]
MRMLSLAILSIILLNIVLYPVANTASSDYKTEQYPDCSIYSAEKLYLVIYTKDLYMKIRLNDRPSVQQVIIKGVNLEIKRHYPLWRIDFLDGDSISAYDFKFISYNIDNEKKSCSILYSNIEHNINATVYFKVDNKRILTNIRLDNHSGKIIYRIYYMLIGGIEKIGKNRDDDKVVIPVQSGVLINNPLESLPQQGAEYIYPSPLSMQFILFYDDEAGLYYGIHDNESNYKRFFIAPFTYDSQAIKMSWILFPEELTTNNSFQPKYNIVLQAFNGLDWRTGADIYANWSRSQWYTQKGPIEVRYRYNNSWIPNIKVWLKPSLPHEVSKLDSWFNKIYNTYKYLFNETNFSNAVVDIWDWNRGGFDNDYPEYFPSIIGDENLNNTLIKFKKLGAKVTLYLNGRLVDTDTETFKRIKEHLPLDTNNSYYIEKYYRGRTHDYLVAAVAHPADVLWQDILLNVSREVVRRYNVDIIFLDQIAVASPIIDFSGKHNYSFKAGNIWWKSYAKILTKIKAELNDIPISVEGLSEVYIPYVDFFWLFQTYDVRSSGNITIIPLFNYIYHGYTIILNQNTNPNNLEFFKYTLETTIANGYVFRFDDIILSGNETILRIIKELIDRYFIINKKIDLLSILYNKVDSVVLYKPRHILVEGSARSKEGNIIYKVVYKPMVDYYYFNYKDDLYLFLYIYCVGKNDKQLVEIDLLNETLLVNPQDYGQFLLIKIDKQYKNIINNTNKEINNSVTNNTDINQNNTTKNLSQTSFITKKIKTEITDWIMLFGIVFSSVVLLLVTLSRYIVK